VVGAEGFEPPTLAL